jgi:hypothetical protein
MIGVGHEVFKGLVRVAQPGRAPEGAQTARQPQQPRPAAPAPQQPPADPGTGFRGGSSNGTAQRQTDVGTGFRNGAANGVAKPQVDPGTGFRNGGTNGAAHPQAEAGTGVRNGGNNGNGVTAPATKANATTYWQKANDHTGKLDRTQFSALAKQVIDGKLTWLEAQSWLDDWIDAATLPSFGASNGKAVAERVPVVASVKPMAERASDPLDELFE